MTMRKGIAKVATYAVLVTGLTLMLDTTRAVAAPSVALPKKVEIFTTDAFPIAGIEELRRRSGANNVVVYALDGVQKVENDFPIYGAKDEKSAVALAKKVLMANRNEITKRVNHAYMGLYRAAFAYNLEKYPAIVLDQRYVAYGAAHVELALHKFNDVRPATVK